MSGFEDTFDSAGLADLDSALRVGAAYRESRQRVIDAFVAPRLNVSRELWGLARVLDAQVVYNTSPEFWWMPRGWKWERDHSRDVFLLIPTWLFWLRALRFVWWDFCRVAIRWGFFHGQEGATFSDHHWSLRVWANPNYGRIWQRPECEHAAARWYRWTNRLHADWLARMPRWTE